MFKKMFNKWHKILGWIGMVLILVSYSLLNLGRVSTDSQAYLAANLLGALLLAYHAHATRAHALLVLNLIWAGIAVWGLVGLM